MDISTTKTSRACSFFVALVMLLLLLPLSGTAATEQYVRVTTDNVLFRKAAGTSSSDFWTRLPEGWTLMYLDAVDKSGVTWYKVQGGTPKAPSRTYIGYLHENYARLLTPEECDAWEANPVQPQGDAGSPDKTATPKPDAPASGGILSGYGITTVGGASLRTSPGGTSMLALAMGTVVTVLEVPATENDAANFYKVSYDGFTGYIASTMMRQLSQSEVGTVTTPTPKPGATAAPGTTVTPIGSRIGYVKITASGVNVRKEPAGTVIGTVSRNKVLPYYSVSYRVKGYDWVYVPVSASEYGYVRSDCFKYCDENGDTVATPVPTSAPTPSPTPEGGVPSGTILITQNDVNVRLTRGGTVIAQVKKGEELPYYGAIVRQSGYGWAYVRTDAGVWGYVRSDCYTLVGQSATPTPAAPTDVPGAGYILLVKNKVNLRQRVGGESTAQLDAGTILPYMDISKKEANGSGYDWYYVSSDKGLGYIRGDCARITDQSGATPAPTQEPLPDTNYAGYVIVTADFVNGRDIPDMDGSVLTNFVKEVYMPYYKTVSGDGYTWYVVPYLTGVNCYVRSEYVRKMTQKEIDELLYDATPAPDATKGPNGSIGYIVTTKSSVYLRKAAQTGAGYYKQIALGVVMPYLEIKSGSGYTWYGVTYQGDVVGYLRGDCVRKLSQAEIDAYLSGGSTPAPQPTATPKPTTTKYIMTTLDDVWLRKSASSSAGTAGQVPKGTVMQYSATTTVGGVLWYKVKYGLVDCYIRGNCARVLNSNEYQEYINAQPTPTPTPAPTAVPPAEDISSTAVTRQNNVIIRATGTTSGTMTEKIYNAGTGVTLLGSTNASNGYTFRYIQVISSGIRGWIRDDMLRILTKDEEALYKQVGDPDAPKEASYRTLSRGSTGADVRTLAQTLSVKGYLATAEVSSSYTVAVETAVKAFQKAEKLTVDGIAGEKTQHKLYNTVPVGTYSGGTVTPTLGAVELIDWYTGGIQSIFYKGCIATVTDVYTGISFKIKRWSGAYHADVEPLTANDTAAMCRVYGVSTAQAISDNNMYQRRPLWVTIGSRTFAASMYGIPHNYPDGDTISDNEFNGQFCIHFVNSHTHGTYVVDKDHQAAIQYAYTHAAEKK